MKAAQTEQLYGYIKRVLEKDVFHYYLLIYAHVYTYIETVYYAVTTYLPVALG
jgi:hypothetical protein